MARQQQQLPSLDHTGTQAAIYPSEQTLWMVGPPINAPLDQGITAVGELGQEPAPFVPTPQQAALTEDWLHEVMNGETPNEAYWEDVVNNRVLGPQGFGEWAYSYGQDGHSQNVRSNPSSEQGWGVGPARRFSHYPYQDAPNPARNEGQHLRNGQLPWVSVDSSLYQRSQLAWEQQWDKYKRRSPVAPVVPVPQSVPFVQTVPTFSGGPSPYPGVDMPIGDSGIWG